MVRPKIRENIRRFLLILLAVFFIARIAFTLLLKDYGIFPNIGDTYDEYKGQNKYGSDRTATSTPFQGKSLRLETP